MGEMKRATMASYTIGNENTVTAHAGPPGGAGAGETFASARELAKATAAWPVSRLAEVRNKLSIRGEKPDRLRLPARAIAPPGAPPDQLL